MTTEGPPVPTGPGASYTYRGRLIPHYETFCFFAIYIYISPPLASVFYTWQRVHVKVTHFE